MGKFKEICQCMQYNLRIVSVIVLILTLQISRVLALAGQYVLKVQENTELDVNNLDSIIGATMPECLQHCLADCRCMSFDMCNDNKCYLKPTNRELAPSKLKSSDRCRFVEIKEEDNQQCDHGCMSAVNCCLTSNPCANGGTCSPSTVTTKKRFHCTCKPGFTGKYCKKCSTTGYTGSYCQDKITSCKGYYLDGKRTSGYFTIFDINDADQTFPVYCDFDKESNMAWTLIQSFALKNVAYFKYRFQNDMPINMIDPNWSSYRLSKPQMASIKVDSTKWRITCEFQQNEKVEYRDYVRASLQDVDILTFNKTECGKVEYINVRGNNCTNCTAYLYQTETLSFHFDSFNSLKLEEQFSACDFKALRGIFCRDYGGEDNFGHYRCINEDHRCVTNTNSTTQTWLGG